MDYEPVTEVCSQNTYSRFLAMMPNDEVNSLAAMELADVFGRADVYQLTPETVDVGRQSQVSQHLHARLLFGEHATSYHLRARGPWSGDQKDEARR